MDELRFIADTLKDAGGDFTEAGTEVSIARDVYAPRGSMQGNPFGLVQGASEDLHQQYAEFFQSVLAELDGLKSALSNGSTDLKLSSEQYSTANQASTPS
ncbi:hypothetical protein [Nonomuraea sediminis]|uniref:hypothetical protein n=1 Tax=Nonomuraea sediminis TaxID=2835864 RepID=UPI001BDBDB1B|nr:hypothetical protein [Nonomuraea sediminis]